MTVFPLAHSVTHIPYGGDAEDSLGNTIPGWYLDPVVRRVYAIAPHVVEEGSATSTEVEVAELDVFAPKFPVDLKDRFEIDGQGFEVVAVKDWTKGFHGWQPGIVIELKRWT